MILHHFIAIQFISNQDEQPSSRLNLLSAIRTKDFPCSQLQQYDPSMSVQFTQPLLFPQQQMHAPTTAPENSTLQISTVCVNMVLLA